MNRCTQFLQGEAGVRYASAKTHNCRSNFFQRSGPKTKIRLIHLWNEVEAHVTCDDDLHSILSASRHQSFFILENPPERHLTRYAARISCACCVVALP